MAAAIACLLSFFFLPSWPREWLGVAGLASDYQIMAAMAVPSGAVTLAFILQFNALGFQADLGLGSLFARYIMIATVFLPATVIVLRRPNVGHLPPWAERVTRKLPHWARGETAEW